MKKLFWLTILTAILGANPEFAQSTGGSVYMSDVAAARFLDQATWGPTPASIAQLQQMGVSNWLVWQFSLNTSDLPDQPILTADGKLNRDLRPVQRAFFENALHGDDQLRQRVAFALSEIWVVSAVQVPAAYAFPPYWRIFRDNAFANYRDIIKAVTISPAMGTYLNVANNNKGNPAKGISANENYARELMQLFTLGLAQLNPDGSPVLDPNHQPIPTYDQDVVVNMAKVLTGWTYSTAPGAVKKNNNPPYYFGQMFAVEQNHDTSAKTIFGNYTIPGGQTAEHDLESLINALMDQQTMAPFICQQLIQHLVTSNPSPAYIQRVASVFLDNGAGVRGDMKSVITAILTDPEARAADQPSVTGNANFGHLREPVLFVANLLRGLNATLTDTSAPFNLTNLMGQNLFYAPSVFSYFSPQYRTEKGLLGPEFQIYSTQTAAERADIVAAAVYAAPDRGTKVDLTPFLQYGTRDVDALLDYASYVFLHHTMSDSLRQAAASAANAAPTPLRRVQAALYVVLTSGEYQVIH